MCIEVPLYFVLFKEIFIHYPYFTFFLEYPPPIFPSLQTTDELNRSICMHFIFTNCPVPFTAYDTELFQEIAYGKNDVTLNQSSLRFNSLSFQDFHFKTSICYTCIFQLHIMYGISRFSRLTD